MTEISTHKSPQETGLAGALGYAAVGLVLLIVASNILQKAGVPPTILTWSNIIFFSVIIIVPGYFFRPGGFRGFTMADGSQSASVSAAAQLFALAPCGLLAAFLFVDSRTVPLLWMALAGLTGGLVISTAVSASAINRTGTLNLADYLQTRFDSSAVGLLATIVAALPVFALFCGQLVAVGMIANTLLGIDARSTAVSAAILTTILVLLPGQRGVVLASAGCLMAIAGGCIATYLRSGQTAFAVSYPSERMIDPDSWRLIAGFSLPFLPQSAASGATTVLAALAFVACLIAGLSVLPLFSQWHCMVETGTRALRASATALFWLGLLVFVFLVVIVPDGGFLDALNNPFDWRGSDDIAMLDRFLGLIWMATFLIFGAILLFGLAAMLFGYGRPDGARRWIRPIRRLAATRFGILLLCAAALWVVLEAPHWIRPGAQLGLALAAATLFPTMLAAAWWKRCGHVAALTGMLVGGYATLTYLASVYYDGGFIGEIDRTISMVAGGHPPIAAAVIGIGSGAILLVATALFFPQRSERLSGGAAIRSGPVDLAEVD